MDKVAKYRESIQTLSTQYASDNLYDREVETPIYTVGSLLV
jgi:hypothetical protein